MLQSLFSSQVPVKLLTHFFTPPEERFYACALSRQFEEHHNAVWQELNTLAQIGLLISEQDVNVKYCHLNPKFPIYDELKRIILKTSGLGGALREALVHLGTAELGQRLRDGDPFTRNVLNGPKIALTGDEDALRHAAETAPD